MSAEQEELARELFIADNFNQPRESSIEDWEWLSENRRSKGSVDHYFRMADTALTVGYRKPYTITTAAERATLKPGTIAVDPDGNAWKLGTGSWVSTGGDTPPLFDEDDYTLTILQEPSA